MATDSAGLRRRAWLLGAAAGLAGWASPGAARASRHTAASALATAWVDREGQAHAGLLRTGAGGTLGVVRQLPLPTRAHGLVRLPDGALLVLARRPGEWLLRWQPAQRGAAARRWVAPSADRRLSGHAVLDHTGRLFCSETDLASGAGLVVQRHPHTLEPVAEWPSHGIDPHALLAHPDGTLFVANGGVPAAAVEAGRARPVDGVVESSLVRMDCSTGRVLGQWRLADPWLSMRHLAWHAPSARVGVALQAEHPTPAEREVAPLLACWHAGRLRPVAGTGRLRGYAGDIAAQPRGFALSATCAHRVLHVAAPTSAVVHVAAPTSAVVHVAAAMPAADAVDSTEPTGACDLAFSHLEAGPSPCALAHGAGRLWVGTDGGSGLRLDNHWIWLG
jgi:uncharacterized protein